MTNKTEDFKNSTPLTAKKQWITPKAEVISNDTVKGGGTPGGTEGQHTISGGFYHS